ncbi:uncharacterized protein LOC127455248 isoform X2 [Myxocyprinus asiaticus]|uniref:uncharacterized protein LOC127455248 isoform X2 n=1 Tax=Myxocyprinus asiaticus TaxID=70543 RepID=UPI0022224644|nr:uncharacterized protein LOC127455248 isoform X2 [Myxocyprinus asiaticus]
MEELINTGLSDVVGRLAFKYMMCKVDSSLDSESETNPRWSDACESSTPEKHAASQKLQRLSGQNYQQCLDPYDGSSEDSDSSNKGAKRQRPGTLRMKGRGHRSDRDVRRAVTRQDLPEHHDVDIQMRSSSDSEQGFWSPCQAVTCVKVDLSDSGFNTRSSIISPAVPSGTETSLHTTESNSKWIQSGWVQASPGSPDSPAFHGAFSKRKFFPPSGDVDEGMRRKRPCISDMEVEHVAF